MAKNRRPSGTRAGRSDSREEARRNLRDDLELGEEMAKLLLLGAQVIDTALMRSDFERHAADAHAIALQAFDFVRVIGQQPRLADAKVAQNLSADPVVAQILLESELQIGLNRVEALVLQRVSLDLVRQPDTTPFLMQVDDYASLGSQDPFDGFGQLLAAIAALGAENVAGKALRMQPHQRRATAANIALDQGQMLAAVHRAPEHHRLELA